MHWLIIWLLSASVTCLKATMLCPQCYPSPCDGPHNVFIKTVPPLLGACIFYQWRELLPSYASYGGCVYVSVQYHEDCHSASYSGRRFEKLSEVFLNVVVPAKLAVKAQTVYAPLFANEKSVIVCNGGLNYLLPTSPPRCVKSILLPSIHSFLFI